jgi:CMP-N,N'-diacetyllegionaminic acid synthase
MSNIAIIPARGGSKGIPGKNVIPLCGRPLIEYSIEVAIESSSVDYVVISSDSAEILEVSKKFGKKVIPIQRPHELAMDNSSTESVVIHAADFLVSRGITIDCIVLLQPTSPFRKVEFVDDSITLLMSSKEGSLISVSDPIQHPYDFLFDDDGVINYVCRNESSYRRQDFKAAKFINGSIYITKYEFLMQTGKIYSLDSCLLYEIPMEFSIDIDTPFDLMLCESIMKNAKGKEQL